MARSMHSSNLPLRSPVFVGGTGRSGTTVFARLLGAHPDIFSLRWESQFIVARHGMIDLVDAGLGKAELGKFLELMRGRWFKRTLNKGKPNEYDAGLSADLSQERLDGAIERLQEGARSGSADGSRIAAEFIAGLLEERTLQAGATRWCEKTPRNSIYFDRLAQMFPEGKFINVLRDGRDVACSMVERGFWPIAASLDFPSTSEFRGEVTFEKAIRYWVEMVRISREVAARLPEGSYAEVRLEDLVYEQEAEVRRVTGFLGESPDEALIEFDMRSDSLGRWRRELKPSQVRLTDEIAGEALAADGYPV
jgi:hypothetical protein